MRVFVLSAIAALLALFTSTVAKENPTSAALDKKFNTSVRPFMETYCLTCHNKEKSKGDLDLTPYNSLSAVVDGFKHWEMALDRLEANEMPPKKAEKHPSAEQRKAIVDWILAVRRYEADRNAGDPGIVLARRLSNAEYDYTIRDLTGQDLRPTREFPVDPSNLAGFDNSGESLTMSPALLKKYLGAAKEVSEHVVLKPDGLDFASHPMLVETDRDKYCVQRIVQFYQRQPTDLADYFEAAWRFQNRAALGKAKATLDDIAHDSKVSPKYLLTIWSALQTHEEVGPIAELQEMWKALPVAQRGKPADDIHSACVEMRKFVVTLRQKIVPEVKNLSIREVNPSAQALVLWKDRQWSINRRKYDPGLLQVDGKVPAQTEESTNKPASYNRKKVKPKKIEEDPKLFVPSDPALRAKYEASFARFAATFPDAFYVKERARTFVDPEEEKANGNVGRLLSAGFHNMTGYYRDDGPLYDMVLDDKGQRELDRLWDEFNLIASVPQRMHQSTLYFERTDSRFMSEAQFDFARPENKEALSEANVRKLAELYYAKAQKLNASETALGAVKEHFERVVVDLNHVETLARAAEPKHIEGLQKLAERAYRRPLTSDERASIVAFYKNMRDQEGISHEEAIRDAVASILMSPNYLYRVDLAAQGKRVQPLDDFSLASRLSYFLWASMPDNELLARAAAGDLHKRDVLVKQTRRMLQDDRARGLATEFLGHWLDFRRFEEHNSVDRERFPQFDNALRAAMFEEPVRLFMDVVKQNRAALDFLYAKDTFVNPVLARHYGIEVPADLRSNDWFHVTDAQKYDRGGILPMAVFLTKNAPGLRTSPVKRGFWVVHRVLGETIPPPPPTVTELPQDESKMGNLTLREALAKHREDPACAGCHARFDSYGLVFEGYGPVGERRAKDLGGKPVDARAPFADGSEKDGVQGLREFLKGHREDDFLNTLCRELLAYGLGRSLIISDDSTIREMRSKLAANANRFDTLIESVVASPQFLNKRGQETLAKN